MMPARLNSIECSIVSCSHWVYVGAPSAAVYPSFIWKIVGRMMNYFKNENIICSKTPTFLCFSAFCKFHSTAVLLYISRAGRFTRWDILAILEDCITYRRAKSGVGYVTCISLFAS